MAMMDCLALCPLLLVDVREDGSGTSNDSRRRTRSSIMEYYRKLYESLLDKQQSACKPLPEGMTNLERTPAEDTKDIAAEVRNHHNHLDYLVASAMARFHGFLIGKRRCPISKRFVDGPVMDDDLKRKAVCSFVTSLMRKLSCSVCGKKSHSYNMTDDIENCRNDPDFVPLCVKLNTLQGLSHGPGNHNLSNTFGGYDDDDNTSLKCEDAISTGYMSIDKTKTEKEIREFNSLRYFYALKLTNLRREKMSMPPIVDEYGNDDAYGERPWEKHRLWRKEIDEESFLMASVLTHEKCYSINTSNLREAPDLARELVRMDRLPKDEQLEGLQLLRDAWDEYDMKTYLSKRYKLFSKFLYMMLLGTGILTVVLTVWFYEDRGTESSRVQEGEIQHSVFGTSLLSAGIVSVGTAINPGQRWRRLRACCCLLETNIYLYRTRVQNYETTNRDRSAAQTALRKFLMEWRDKVSGGTDLSSTSMERKFPRSVYKHFQRDCAPGVMKKMTSKDDDYHKPLSPNDYIRWRLQPMLSFYQGRLPTYQRRCFIFQMLLILCTTSCACFSYLNMQAAVTVAAVVVGTISSWVEFSDYTKKLERYTSATQELKNVLTWWSSLSDVEQASRESITDLVVNTEGAISSEYTAWSSAGKKQNRQQDREEESDKPRQKED